MKLSLSFSAVAVAVVLAALSAGCSGNDGEIELEAVQTPLTENGGDHLFTIAIVKAREGGYAPDTVKVKVTPDGKDAIEVACVVTDVNANQTLDAGDKLACSESAKNDLGAALAGQEVDVELFATVDGSEERVGDATWTPAK
jgi:hypothetical protein